MSCGSTPVFSDSRLPMEGMFVPGSGIYLNLNLMKRQPEMVRIFVYRHECTHKTVGGNELAADCAAAQSGAREGWLSQTGVDGVCKSLAGQPAGGRYPSGTTRCANIRSVTPVRWNELSNRTLTHKSLLAAADCGLQIKSYRSSFGSERSPRWYRHLRWPSHEVCFWDLAASAKDERQRLGVTDTDRPGRKNRNLMRLRFQSRAFLERYHPRALREP
jgi:hypothetical protein